jgi:plasmid stabilization system protein ParE
MADRYTVRISKRALSDLQSIVEYIFENSPQNAAGVADRLLTAMSGLDRMPTRFRVAGKSRKLGTPVHARVERPFIIYYSVNERERLTMILHVRHGARQQPTRFE